MWDLVLLRRIIYPLSADDKQKKGKVSTFPLNPPVEKGGLGPATQDNTSFCLYWLIAISFFLGITYFPYSYIKSQQFLILNSLFLIYFCYLCAISFLYK